MDLKNNTEEFLKAFFKFFNASPTFLEMKGGKVRGNLKWNDSDETQEFLWINNISDTELRSLKIACNYLSDNGMLKGDKFLLSEEELVQKLKTLNFSEFEARSIVNLLCEIEIKMVDGGEESDSFFIHF